MDVAALGRLVPQATVVSADAELRALAHDQAFDPGGIMDPRTLRAG